MNFIHASEILIADNRIRRDFNPEKLEELANGIESKGLIHPPVLRYNTELNAVLVAGERRIRAMRELHSAGRTFSVVSTNNAMEPVPNGMIPYLLLSELSEDDLLEAELEENSLRDDLTWQEQADAVGRLHRLRKAMDPKWTIKQTNEEITDDTGAPREQAHYPATSRMIILSENLTNDLVRNSKDPAMAMKVLRKQAQEHLSTTFADYLELKGEDEVGPQIFNVDGVEHLLQNASRYDLIMADPPYGINAQAFNNFEAGIYHEYNDGPKQFRELFSRFAVASYVACMERAHMYCFCDIRHWQFMRETLEAAGWDVWNWPIVWVKRGHGLVPSPENGPSRMHELIMFARKGDMKVTAVRPDVVPFAKAEDKIHAAQKPLALIKDLIARSLDPGEGRVCDPFCGSGTTITACREMNLEVVGCEIDEVMYKRALIRIVTEVETDH